MLFLIFFLSLQCIGLYSPCSGDAIKRESGANPEQSRCCKFHISTARHPTIKCIASMMGSGYFTSLARSLFQPLVCLLVHFLLFLHFMVHYLCSILQIYKIVFMMEA